MEIASQHDSQYVPESSTLRWCSVCNYRNNDNPLLLTLWKNHEKTYPKLPFGAQPGKNARVMGQACWTCHFFWQINILNPCPIVENHSLFFIEVKSVIHSFSLLRVGMDIATWPRLHQPQVSSSPRNRRSVSNQKWHEMTVSHGSTRGHWGVGYKTAGVVLAVEGHHGASSTLWWSWLPDHSDIWSATCILSIFFFPA